MTVLLLDKSKALCEMAGHLVESYVASSHDPGADVCREEGCLSEALVALWNAGQSLREARVHLDGFRCCPPGECRCSFEFLRIDTARAVKDVDYELGVLLHCAFPSDSNDAEALLCGVAPSWPEAAP